MFVFDLISSFLCLYSSLLCSYVDECFKLDAPSREWETCHLQSLGLILFSAVAIGGGVIMVAALISQNFEEMASEYEENVEFAIRNTEDEIQPKKSKAHSMMAAGDALLSWEASSDKKND
ncbi:hypothetical protein M3Y94_01273900 [Aphelenchoides besseyi]|nr:hypothetical protein M3Y94_01273900 [Aphelenchoides besseyi]KAI6222660.1 hypothetical protein M3Y95_00917100 [Aphelenchoides besseyi]